MKERRNQSVEVYRFVAAVTIIFHHSTGVTGEAIAPGGWIFVEFFYFLSGFFMTRHCYLEQYGLNSGGPEKKRVRTDTVEKQALLYTWKTYKKVLPFAILGVCIDACAWVLNGQVRLDGIGNLIADLPLHFLMLKGGGLTSYPLNGPLWFMTALLLVMPWVYLFMRKRPQLYQYVVCWTVPIFIYAGMLIMNGTVQYWDNGWTVNGFFRALAGLMIGSVLFFLSQMGAVYEFIRKNLRYLRIIELYGVGYCVANAFTDDCKENTFVCFLFLAVSLLISLNRPAKVHSGHFDLSVLGRLSIPMFCVHVPVFDLFSFFMKEADTTTRLILRIVATLAISVAADCCVRASLHRKTNRLS